MDNELFKKYINNKQSMSLLSITALLILVPREFNMSFGPLVIGPYRIWLICLTPFLIKLLLSKRAFTWRSFDSIALCLCIWPSIALSINTGLLVAIESGGILFLELFTPYFLARQTLNSYSDLQLITKRLLYLIAFLAMLAVPETITGKHYVHDFLGSLTGNAFESLDDKRLGLTRASSLTDHPIILGSISATGVILAFSLFFRHLKYRVFLLASLYGVIASVSSAPLLGVIAQFGLALWSRLFSGYSRKWSLLLLLITLVYIAIDLISDRDPFRVMFSYLLFNEHNGYVRYYMWTNSLFLVNQTTETMMFGYGLSKEMFNLIENPFFSNLMSTTVDSFWLVNLLRYGWPMFFLLAVFVFVLLRFNIQTVLKERRNKKRALLRAWFIAAIGFTLMSLTVHFWGSVSSFYMVVMACAATTFSTRHDKKKIALTQDRP